MMLFGIVWVNMTLFGTAGGPGESKKVHNYQTTENISSFYIVFFISHVSLTSKVATDRGKVEAPGESIGWESGSSRNKRDK